MGSKHQPLMSRILVNFKTKDWVPKLRLCKGRSESMTLDRSRYAKSEQESSCTGLLTQLPTGYAAERGGRTWSNLPATTCLLSG